MKCEFCSGSTIHMKVRKNHWLNGKLYIIENVDAESCLKCGERYFHAKELDRVDSIVQGKHKVKELIEVEVLSA